MNTYQFVTALVAGLPALLVSISTFYHSFQTRQQMSRRITKLEMGGG